MSHNAEHFGRIIIARAVCRPFLEPKCIHLAFTPNHLNQDSKKNYPINLFSFFIKCIFCKRGLGPYSEPLREHESGSSEGESDEDNHVTNNESTGDCAQ